MAPENIDRLELGPWASESVEITLPAEKPGETRASDGPREEPAPDDGPRVRMPERTFDCVRLDALLDHPSIDAIIRAELARGVPFRLIRFPFSITGPRSGRVTMARFTVQLAAHDGTAPRVHSIYPERLEVDGDEDTVEAAIEPQLKIGAAVDVRAGRLGRKIVARHARSTTIGFWSEDGAEWLVKPRYEEAPIEGTWEFFVVLRWAARLTPFRVVLGASAVVASTGGLGSWRTKKVERPYGPVELTGCIPIA